MADSVKNSLRGAVYGDLVGSPYMIENTYNRYFELGETRRAYSHGKVRAFFPEATEISHGAVATSRWLLAEREGPTADGLIDAMRKEFDRHPRGGWTPSTRLLLTSDAAPSSMPDWAAAARTSVIPCFFRDDLFRTLDLAQTCVMATCSNDDAVRMGQALANAVWNSINGSTAPEIFTMLEMQYGLDLTRPEEDLKAELRGEVRVPLEMLGREVEGAYRYVVPDHAETPGAVPVMEAAMRAVLGSDSWEDAVRRAVAFGGPSNAVAGIAGSLAEALYGEVTPSIVGRLYTSLPIGMNDLLDQYEKASVPERRTERTQKEQSDAVTIIGLGPGRTVYVIPEDRDDIRRILDRTIPSARIIRPDEMVEFLKQYDVKRNDTYAYGIRPEVRVLYVQDGAKLVSPSQYIGPGMPSIRERRRHLDEFMKFKTWCIGKQVEMNTRAGNAGAGQVHYDDAYHMWIGSRRIDFLFGDSNAGTVMLDSRGLLRVELGDLRDIGSDARFENHHEQSWAARGVFCIEDTVHPLERLQQMREEIAYRLLDEGVGCESHEIDCRALSDDDRKELYSESNLDRLRRLDSGEDMGCAPSPSVGLASDEPNGVQKVGHIYSIGYGNRSGEAFINTLGMSGIDTVVDIRSIPRSKFTPQFNEEAICASLSSRGIQYFNGGAKLGDKVSDRSLLDASGCVDWNKVMSSEPFMNGIEALCRMASEGHTVAVVSSEGDPLVSHRLGTVSRGLASEGIEVRHIMSNGEVVGQTELEYRLLQKYTDRGMIPSAETGPYSRQVMEAYRAMNREHGFHPEKKRHYIRHH